MRDPDELFAALETSAFRRSVRLGPRERAYLAQKTMPVILEHARGFIAERLVQPASLKDGRQTPRLGHPVFVAQHATGTCCRKCLEKWCHIPRDISLTEEHIAYIVGVIERWLTQWLPTQG
jgi:Iap family predicted aminopeptidase